MDIFSVILAGGGGTRFWPLSRQEMPKQLLNITGNDIMINETISRCESVIPVENTFIVTGKSQADALDKVLLSDVNRANILKEPVGRNTAACILYAALVLKKRYGDAIMVVLPSDHYISDQAAFRNRISKACNLAEISGSMVTIGIKPTFPATGYGYIRYLQHPTGAIPESAFEVGEFVEKPSFDKARSYLEQGNYLWNSGIFVWKVSTILDSFQRFLPRLFHKLESADALLGTAQEQEAIDRIYNDLQSMSIDYGVLERSDNVLVIPGEFGWNDIGSWDALGAVFPPDKDGNVVKAKHIGVGTRNSTIFSNHRLVATIGVENLIIADTPDALLICSRERAQEVKKLVDEMKDHGLQEYT